MYFSNRDISDKLLFLGITLTVTECTKPTTLQVKIFPIVSTMDLIAKAQFLNMVQHNGAYGCKDCLTVGSHIPSGKGYAHCYSYEETLVAASRTEKSFIEDAIKAYKSDKNVRVIVCIYSAYFVG